MISVKQLKLIVVSILILSITACSNNSIFEVTEPTKALEGLVEPTEAGNVVEVIGSETSTSPTSQPLLEEVEVVLLNIPERIQAASFEYSGLAWFGEDLVLLPQFPQGKDFSREANLFTIAKGDLLQAIENPDLELLIRDVPIINSDLRKVIKGFEGFESILFVEGEVYLTIESRAGNPMMGYLIRGEVKGELESITLDPESLVELVPFSSAGNATFEAMTYWNGKLYILYEHNSKQGDKLPVAYQYNLDLELEQEIPFPVVDYRITDATVSDSTGKFWVMNYFFPGDTHLAIDQDALILEYGEGETHANNEPVERLVELQVKNEKITRVDQPPVYLQLLDYNIARNWEGIVMLDDLGFLLITDSFPGSVLGFCRFLR